MLNKKPWPVAHAAALCAVILLSPVTRVVGELDEATPADAGPDRLQPAPDLKYPFFYSISFMVLALPVLEAGGAYDTGYRLNNFERAFTSPPVWESDSVVFNFVLHPLWGSETYLRARESHFSMPESIAFSMGMSITWEYLIESWVEQPSIQDLIFTTGLGWPLGELRYRLKQRTSDRMDWLLDPIQTTLEHMRIVASRDKEGKLSAGIGFAFTF